ncbi:MAG: PASTA domain-containing protein [Spirochaetales bacterium]|nr:PASTA domain-containing protein [Spirochaetales bacterium]
MIDMIKIINKIKDFFPNRTDDPDTRYFKITLFLILGLFGTMILVVFIVFFTNIKGSEEIKVPNVTTTEVTKIDILDAILKLQEKYLDVRIQEKHSSKFARGIVIDQKPRPGAVVKAGRYITLVVSKGPVINKIEDYRGKTLGWLRYELRSKFASDEKALIEIREPVIYQFDESPQGTILDQSPKADTPIYENRVTYINLVVSKGPKGQEKRSAKYIGRSYQDVIKMLSFGNIPFTFEVGEAKDNVREGIVIAQNPEPDEEITPLVPVRLTITPVLKLAEDEIFDIFQYIVEKYPIPVDVTIVSQYQGEITELLSMKHEGGKISFPYRVKSGTEIIVYILDSEENRYIIEKDENSGVMVEEVGEEDDQ